METLSSFLALGLYLISLSMPCTVLLRSIRSPPFLSRPYTLSDRRKLLV